MNRVHFEGRLIRDPEQRTTTTGKTLCKFTLAVRDARNEAQSYFFDCTAWEPVCSQIMATVKKNDQIAVDGRLTTNIYTNREGKTVKAYDTIVENLRRMSAPNQPIPPARSAGIEVAGMPRSSPTETEVDVKQLFAKGEAKKVNIDWMKDLNDEPSTEESEESEGSE